MGEVVLAADGGLHGADGPRRRGANRQRRPRRHPPTLPPIPGSGVIGTSGGGRWHAGGIIPKGSASVMPRGAAGTGRCGNAGPPGVDPGVAWQAPSSRRRSPKPPTVCRGPVVLVATPSRGRRSGGVPFASSIGHLDLAVDDVRRVVQPDDPSLRTALITIGEESADAGAHERQRSRRPRCDPRTSPVASRRRAAWNGRRR